MITNIATYPAAIAAKNISKISCTSIFNWTQLVLFFSSLLSLNVSFTLLQSKKYSCWNKQCLIYLQLFLHHLNIHHQTFMSLHSVNILILVLSFSNVFFYLCTGILHAHFSTFDIWIRPLVELWFWQNYRTLLCALCDSFSLRKQNKNLFSKGFSELLPKSLQCTSAYTLYI